MRLILFSLLLPCLASAQLPAKTFFDLYLHHQKDPAYVVNTYQKHGFTRPLDMGADTHLLVHKDTFDGKAGWSKDSGHIVMSYRSMPGKSVEEFANELLRLGFKEYKTDEPQHYATFKKGRTIARLRYFAPWFSVTITES